MVRDQFSLVQVQFLQGNLQVMQGQRDVLNRQVQTVQQEKAAMTGRVEGLQGDQRRLSGKVVQLEEQNTILGEEADSMQKKLDATVLQQHQVSFKTGLFSLHL